MIEQCASWYLVHTQPNAERKALFNLERQGFASYLPRYQRRRRRARKVEIVLAPLFPRYLFVAIDVTKQRWRCINSTLGVSRLVCHGDTPVIVPTQVIEGLQAHEGTDGSIRLQSRLCFNLGQKVRILDGAFSSCLGLYEGMSDQHRVAILLDLLGRKVRLVLDADLICAA